MQGISVASSGVDLFCRLLQTGIVMTRSHYQGKATYDGTYWSVVVTGLPPKHVCATQGKTWNKALAMTRDAIALLWDVPSDSFDLTLTVADEEIAHRVIASEEDRLTSEKARDQATKSLVAAVKSMRPNIPYRDIGAILRISHQYAEKLDKSVS